MRTNRLLLTALLTGVSVITSLKCGLVPRVDEWNVRNKLLATTYIAGGIVDYHKTKDMFRHPQKGKVETDLFVHNSNDLKRIYLLGGYMLFITADKIPEIRSYLLSLGAFVVMDSNMSRSGHSIIKGWYWK